jgi:hypothetical protein
MVNRNLRHPHILRQHAVRDNGQEICLVNEHTKLGTMLDHILKNNRLQETEARCVRASFLLCPWLSYRHQLVQ